MVKLIVNYYSPDYLTNVLPSPRPDVISWEVPEMMYLQNSEEKMLDSLLGEVIKLRGYVVRPRNSGVSGCDRKRDVDNP